jgi:PmbA protein
MPQKKTISHNSTEQQQDNANNSSVVARRDEFISIAQDALRQAKQLGITSAAVGLGNDQGYNVTVRMGEIEHIERTQGKDLGITVYFGQRVGSASTSDLSAAAIKLTIEKACYIARYTNEDPCAGLADMNLMAYGYKDLDLYHPWSLTIPEAVKLAKQYEQAALNYDKRIINSDGATVNTGQSFGVYANTHGFIGECSTTSHDISCALIAANNEGKKGKDNKENKENQGNNSMQRDGDYTISRHASLLTPAKELGQRAATMALRRLGARRIKTCECPVIFEAPIAKSLIANLLKAISGGNLYNRTSFLCDHLGKQVLAKHLNIDELPLIPQALGSAAFDSEGVKTKQQMIVNDGTLARYILGSYSARKLKMQTTGNAGGCYNIFVNSSNPSISFQDLLYTMKHGLIVIELLGHGINLTTGDYSCGAFGFWVENGKIEHPVEGITIAGNLKDMLLNAVAMSNDIDQRGTIFTGSILLPHMQIGGLAA